MPIFHKARAVQLDRTDYVMRQLTVNQNYYRYAWSLIQPKRTVFSMST